MKNEIYIHGYNKNYYSYLDKIIMRYKKRRITRRLVEMGKDVAKYLFASLVCYGAFYFVWSMLCYVFPEW